MRILQSRADTVMDHWYQDSILNTTRTRTLTLGTVGNSAATIDATNYERGVQQPQAPAGRERGMSRLSLVRWEQADVANPLARPTARRWPPGA